MVARVYLDLGIAQLAGSDQEAAKVAFLSAAQIDPKIQIDPAYKSAELVRMLDDARSAAGDSGGEPASPAGDDCRSIRGIQHAPVEGARRGVAQPIEVLIGGDVSPSRVIVMYRPEGAIDFTEIGSPGSPVAATPARSRRRRCTAPWSTTTSRPTTRTTRC